MNRRSYFSVLGGESTCPGLAEDAQDSADGIQAESRSILDIFLEFEALDRAGVDVDVAITISKDHNMIKRRTHQTVKISRVVRKHLSNCIGRVQRLPRQSS